MRRCLLCGCLVNSQNYPILTCRWQLWSAVIAVFSRTRPTFSKSITVCCIKIRLYQPYENYQGWIFNLYIDKIIAYTISNQVAVNSIDLLQISSQLEEANTHKSAKSRTGTVFVSRDLDRWPFGTKIDDFPALIVELLFVTFGDPSLVGFWDIVRINRQTGRQTVMKTLLLPRVCRRRE